MATNLMKIASEITELENRRADLTARIDALKGEAMALLASERPAARRRPRSSRLRQKMSEGSRAKMREAWQRRKAKQSPPEEGGS